MLELLPLASSAAFEDMKNSVPPLADDVWPGGDVLGHMVKPGCRRHRAGRVELGHRHVGVAAGQCPLREGVDLCPVELGPEERVLVGGDVEAVAVGPDVRVVADARARLAVVRRCAARAVVLDTGAGRSSMCRAGWTCCSRRCRGGSPR